ncbi:MAG: exonuclease SbcCD subunit D [Candidatus Margulisiibacteriota bacterium]|jgi:exonuclease SbcD
MKILHTSDWHLGKRLEQFSRLEEQKEVLAEICEIADQEQVDAIVIAGDLFDAFNPPIEAIELLYKTLKKLANNGKRAVIAIAGNHDSPDRIEAPEPLARECGIIFCGYPNSSIKLFALETGLAITKSDHGFFEINLPGKNIPLRVLCTPYANEARLKTYLGLDDSEAEMRKLLQDQWQTLAANYCDKNGINLLVTHLFIVNKENPELEEPEDEKPILYVGGSQAIYTENIPPQIQYTATGHLHRKQIFEDSNQAIAYSGSPLSFSMKETNQKKFVLITDIEPGQKAKIKEIELTKGKKLVRVKFEDVEAAISWLNQNQETLVELTMITDTFLMADERKQILNAHSGIVAIIPEIKNIQEKEETKKEINLDKSINDLFQDYFRYSKNGQEPNQEILNLFCEVLAVEPNQ